MLENRLIRIKGRILLYGAHLVALECARWLIQNGKGRQIIGVAVTDMNGNPQELSGYYVRNFEDYATECQTITIIIATPEKYHKVIEQHARDRGFCHFLKVSLEDVSRLKGRRILMQQKKYPQLSFRLEEDRYDISWLNMLEQKPDAVSNNSGIGFRFHVKFPTLFYLDAEKVFTEAMALDFPKDYEKICGRYQNLHTLQVSGIPNKSVEELKETILIYMAFSEWDNSGNKVRQYAPWIQPIQVGCKVSGHRCGNIFDDTGDNISDYNHIFAEMTGAFWIWKNVENTKYKGLCHYRRHFIITDEEITALEHNGIDVILTTPRYVPGGIKDMFLEETPVKYEVYNRMLSALSEVSPEDRHSFEKYMSSCFYYPNNMVIARNEIYNDYCAWIFPILFRMRDIDLVTAYGYMRDRHIAYAAELLTSYYFVKNKEILQIAVTDYQFYS